MTERAKQKRTISTYFVAIIVISITTVVFTMFRKPIGNIDQSVANSTLNIQDEISQVRSVDDAFVLASALERLPQDASRETVETFAARIQMSQNHRKTLGNATNGGQVAIEDKIAVNTSVKSKSNDVFRNFQSRMLGSGSEDERAEIRREFSENRQFSK